MKRSGSCSLCVKELAPVTELAHQRPCLLGSVAFANTHWAASLRSYTSAIGGTGRTSKRSTLLVSSCRQRRETVYAWSTKQYIGARARRPFACFSVRLSKIPPFWAVSKAFWSAIVPAATWAAEPEATTTAPISDATESASNAAATAASANGASWTEQLTNWLATIDAVLLISATVLTIIVTAREWRIRNQIREIEKKFNLTDEDQLPGRKRRPKPTTNPPPGNLNRYQRRELRKRRRNDDESL